MGDSRPRLSCEAWGTAALGCRVRAQGAGTRGEGQGTRSEGQGARNREGQPPPTVMGSRRPLLAVWSQGHNVTRSQEPPRVPRLGQQREDRRSKSEERKPPRVPRLCQPWSRVWVPMRCARPAGGGWPPWMPASGTSGPTVQAEGGDPRSLRASVPCLFSLRRSVASSLWSVECRTTNVETAGARGRIDPDIGGAGAVVTL